MTNSTSTTVAKTAKQNQDDLFPTFDDQQIERIAKFGSEVVIDSGDPIFVRGVRGVDLFVVIDGEIELSEKRGPNGHIAFARLSRGQFTGELDLLTGRETLVDCYAVVTSRLARIQRRDFAKMMRSEVEIAESIMRTLIARRSGLIENCRGGLIVLGDRQDGNSLRIERFLIRNGHPYKFLDCDISGNDDIMHVLGLEAADLPAAVLPGTRILRKPSNQSLADALGLTETSAPDTVFDVVVIGAGPAGLAAAVYAASEGLQTIVIEGNAPGGQAGTSSKIENYLGFPMGVSGQELANRAQVQAQKFGARIAISRDVIAIEEAGRQFFLELDGGSRIATRSVVVATGARYRKLDIPDYERFEYQGIHYAATPMEALRCNDQEIAVIGGGNSAGQAALFLSQRARHVHLLIRGEALQATMSDYLIQRIAATSKITLRTETIVTKLAGGSYLQEVTWKDLRNGLTETRPIGNLFAMIGADPNTFWLRNCLELDGKGFIKTGAAAGATTNFATSQPGVFAVGDVRAGSVKRVASAAGEGAAVISEVHGFLASVREYSETVSHAEVKTELFNATGRMFPASPREVPETVST